VAKLRQPEEVLIFVLLVADVDPEKNAIPTPSQGTPEHSQVLTPNLFQNILLTPWIFLTKEKKRSLNNQAVLLKTTVQCKTTIKNR
jgi:hypothetical protein